MHVLLPEAQIGYVVEPPGGPYDVQSPDSRLRHLTNAYAKLNNNGLKPEDIVSFNQNNRTMYNLEKTLTGGISSLLCFYSDLLVITAGIEEQDARRVLCNMFSSTDKVRITVIANHRVNDVSVKDILANYKFTFKRIEPDLMSGFFAYVVTFKLEPPQARSSYGIGVIGNKQPCKIFGRNDNSTFFVSLSQTTYSFLREGYTKIETNYNAPKITGDKVDGVTLVDVVTSSPLINPLENKWHVCFDVLSDAFIASRRMSYDWFLCYPVNETNPSLSIYDGMNLVQRVLPLCNGKDNEQMTNTQGAKLEMMLWIDYADHKFTDIKTKLTGLFNFDETPRVSTVRYSPLYLNAIQAENSLVFNARYFIPGVIIDMKDNAPDSSTATGGTVRAIWTVYNKGITKLPDSIAVVYTGYQGEAKVESSQIRHDDINGIYTISVGYTVPQEASIGRHEFSFVLRDTDTQRIAPFLLTHHVNVSAQAPPTETSAPIDVLVPPEPSSVSRLFRSGGELAQLFDMMV